MSHGFMFKFIFEVTSSLSGSIFHSDSGKYFNILNYLELTLGETDASMFIPTYHQETIFRSKLYLPSEGDLFVTEIPEEVFI